MSKWLGSPYPSSFVGILILHRLQPLYTFRLDCVNFYNILDVFSETDHDIRKYKLLACLFHYDISDKTSWWQNEQAFYVIDIGIWGYIANLYDSKNKIVFKSTHNFIEHCQIMSLLYEDHKMS